MKRREFMRSATLGFASGILGVGCRTSLYWRANGTTKKNHQRPNILFAISDDQSYPHTSILGDPVVKTPALDRVAREGILFTQNSTI